MQVILGAGGAIGNELARELVKYEKNLRLVSRNPHKINETDELISGDITNKDVVDEAVRGANVVYLTAGLEYKAKVWQQKWPVIMRNVIESCKKNSARLVFFDNAYMYDPSYLNNLTETTPVKPITKKGKVRAQIAETLLEEVQKGEVNAMIVRAADFYGPQVETSVMMETVYKRYRSGKKAIWMGNPKCVHSMTYTVDAAKATALLGNTPDAYNTVWHLPTESEKLTGREWISLFAEAMHVEPKYMTMSGTVIKLIGFIIPFFREIGEMMYQFEKDYYFNCDKFKKRFPAFTIMSPSQGVKEVLRGV